MSSEIKDLVFDILLEFVPENLARQYSESWAVPLIEWNLSKILLDIDSSDSPIMKKRKIKIISRITQAALPYKLSFSEVVKLGMAEVKDEDLEEYKRDAEAFAEIEALSFDGPLTQEHIELFTILIEGLDPAHFKFAEKPYVTKEEISNFRELASKFGVQDSLISSCIKQVTSGTPMGYVQRIIDIQNEIDKRRILHSNLDGRCFGREMLWKGHLGGDEK